MRRSFSLVAVAVAAAVVVPFAVVSCGGSSAKPPAAPPGVASTSAPPPASASASAEVAWKDMSVPQKREYMKKVVLPKMRTLFTAFDEKTFEDMGCKTCHGDGMKDQTFKMPNPDLPPLSVEGGFKKHKDETPEITEFMMTRVVPEMAQLLGTTPYDPKTQKGFGCFGCHTMEKK
jgi:hypothetical protein